MKSDIKFILLFFAIILYSLTGYAKAQDAEDEGEESEIVQVDTLTIDSKFLGQPTKAVVILPTQYFEADMENERFPVVYLLHGFSGRYSNWVKKYDDLDQVADDSGFIFICPDGKNGWYWDSPKDKNSQYESYITKELVPLIDSKYRTVKSSGMRAITGLSMGGHGALWLAMRHPNIFGVCGSMSGGVDIVSLKGKWNINSLLGDYNTNKAVHESHSVFSLVPKLRNGQLKIIFDCGSDDFLYKANLKLHNALLRKGIRHDFISRPGNHTWDYWTNSLNYQLLFFEKAFDANSESK